MVAEIAPMVTETVCATQYGFSHRRGIGFGYFTWPVAGFKNAFCLMTVIVA